MRPRGVPHFEVTVWGGGATPGAIASQTPVSGGAAATPWSVGVNGRFTAGPGRLVARADAFGATVGRDRRSEPASSSTLASSSGGFVAFPLFLCASFLLRRPSMAVSSERPPQPCGKETPGVD